MIHGKPDAAGLAEQGLDWLLASAREQGSALEWSTFEGDDEVDPILYSGAAGIVITLIEAYRQLGDERYAEAAIRGARSVASLADEQWEASSLYFGLAGMAWALRVVQRLLGEDDAGRAADRALAIVRDRFDGQRWSVQFELLGGNAGIALAAAAAGDLDLALIAVTPYLATAEPTPAGVTWEVLRGAPARFHHISHGTLGIVYALAEVGRAAGRPDLVDLALAGAADVVSRNEAGEAGFLVAHSDPQHKPHLIERYSYGWCHGPAGDAQAFRLLADVTGNQAWTALAERCWPTVLGSGLPARLRLGFWDNNGRCCGTAGVLAFACDRQVEHGDGLDFAGLLVADLAARATVDDLGARWRNYEHRATPSDLPPRPGWAHGSAGIVRELLRYGRITSGGDPGYAVDWPGLNLHRKGKADDDDT